MADCCLPRRHHGFPDCHAAFFWNTTHGQDAHATDPVSIGRPDGLGTGCPLFSLQWSAGLFPRIAVRICLRACVLLSFLSIGISAAEAGPADVTAGILAELEPISGVRVFGRADLRILPGEEVDSNAVRRDIGRRMGADILLLIESRRIAFGFVDAQTGEELFRIREDTPERLARSAFALVQEQRDMQTVRLTVVILLEKPGCLKFRKLRTVPDYFEDFSNHSMKAEGPPAR